MEENNLENELIVNDDVPETSEKEGSLENTETKASEFGVEEGNQKEKGQDDIEKIIKERVSQEVEEKIEDRLIRDRASKEKKHKAEMAKYKQLEKVITTGLGVSSLDEAIKQASDFYKNQGIEIPEYVDEQSEWEQKVLAKAYADNFKSLGIEEMEAEANRISAIPQDKRSVKEQELFLNLCEAIIDLRQSDDLKSKGIDTDILEEKEFREFKKKFNINTPIAEIYEMYKLSNSKKEEEVKTKPASAGSAKSEGAQTKEVFTPERINSMSPQELKKYWNNPAFRQVAGLNKEEN